MNTIEQLQGEVAALSLRIVRLEKLAAGATQGAHDETEAQRLAGELGYEPQVLLKPARTAERRKLARALHGQGWSGSRLARTFRCCEKTVERWLA